MHDEDMIFLVKGKILVFHWCLYNKMKFKMVTVSPKSSIRTMIKITQCRKHNIHVDQYISYDGKRL